MNATTTPPAASLDRIVCLRERTETSLYHWQRILEDAEQFRTTANVRNAREQIVWIRGYLRALDDVLHSTTILSRLDSCKP